MARKIHCATVFAALAITFSAQAENAAPRNRQNESFALTGGQIKTPSGWVDSMLVREGIIVALGDENSIRSRADKNTRIVKLEGKTVLPGIHDAHVHPLYGGMEQTLCGFPASAVPEVIDATVRACAAKKKAGEWIKGGNWVGAVFKPGQQTKAFLDAAAPRNPVILIDEAHHSSWVNSKVLEVAGITRDTPNPAGGIIERDARGEPTGLLRESASRLVDKFVPPASAAETQQAVVLASNQMLSFGITSYTVASVRGDDIRAFSAMSGNGLIKQYVRGCIVWPGQPGGEDLVAIRAQYAKPSFNLDCVKIFVDGVPTESHTGGMLENYHDIHADGNDNRPAKGMLMIQQEALDQAVTRFDAQGLSVKFHAAGDAAVRAAIDAVASAHRTNGYGGPMHAVGHSTFVAEADILRVREVQMAFEFSPYIWYPTPIASVDILKAVGQDRMRRWVPIREAVETGALTVAGSDWPVVPSVNPWLGMETMVTRRKPGGSDDALGEAEKVSLEQAFKLFTIGGARLIGRSDKIGTIEVGKQADLIVTDINPFEVAITEVHKTKVQKTYINGTIVFDIDHPPRLTVQ